MIAMETTLGTSIELFLANISVVILFVCGISLFIWGSMPKRVWESRIMMWIVSIMMIFVGITMYKHGTQRALNDNREVIAQEHALIHPKAQTLTENYVRKTFTDDDPNYTMDQQINAYINSITNLKDYHVNVKDNPNHNLIINRNQKSKVVELIRKDITK